MNAGSFNTRKILILGTGKVAKTLANQFVNIDGIEVTVWGRSSAALNQLPLSKNLIIEEDLFKACSRAQFIIIAVSDDSIQKVSSQLANVKVPVVHLSGATSIDVLLSENISNCGVCWPIMTFRQENFSWMKNIPMVIEANNSKTYDAIKSIFSLLSFKFYKIPFEKRKILHLAAVISNNFTHHLLNVVHQIMQKENLPPEAIEPLLHETVRNVNWETLKETQTGPAARGDLKTINEHLDWLQHNQTWLDLYNDITKSIQRIHSEKSQE